MGEDCLGCYTSLFAILLDTDPPRVWMDGLPIKIQNLRKFGRLRSFLPSFLPVFSPFLHFFVSSFSFLSLVLAFVFAPFNPVFRRSLFPFSVSFVLSSFHLVFCPYSLYPRLSSFLPSFLSLLFLLPFSLSFVLISFLPVFSPYFLSLGLSSLRPLSLSFVLT